MHLLLGAGDQVLEEVDRDVLVFGEVCTGINRQEEEDLPLAVELRGELGRRDLLARVGTDVDDFVH